VSHVPLRRSFLRKTTSIAAAGALFTIVPGIAAAALQPRSLAFDHTHTLETLSLIYARGESYIPQALGRLNYFLRDHYSGLVGEMDPNLYDILHRLRVALGTKQAIEVISAYRHPSTNEHLRKTRGGGVAKRSLHMDGKAMDIRLPGVSLVELRDAALALKAGGVGYYPRSNFVHVDTGRVRSW